MNKTTIDSETLNNILVETIKYNNKEVKEVVEEIAVKIDEHFFRNGKIKKRGLFSNLVKNS